MRKLLLLSLILLFNGVVALGQDYLMPTSGSVSYTACSGNFYDDGGSANDYSTSVNSIVTIYPSTPGAKLSVNFSSFQTDPNQDILYVYNGHDINAPLIATLTGSSGYGTIASSAQDGSLTFKFISDGNDRGGGYEVGWKATISCSSAPPNDITMIASGSFTTCGGNFYDGGGPLGDYMTNQNSVVTLYPSTPGAKLSVNFSSFQSDPNQDILYVYNGHDINAPLIATLSGSSGYGTIASSAQDGSLTFKFISDGNDRGGGYEVGWKATISCSSAPPDDITMIASGSFTTCGGNFYDGGGPLGDYMTNQNSVVTLYPSTPGAKLSVNFSSFQSDPNQDILYVYNGHDINAPLIATLSGSSRYGTIASSAQDGSLTFKFISDGNDRGGGYEVGWKATIACNIKPYQLQYAPAVNKIGQNSDQATTAEPIQLGTGTYYYKHTDINIPVSNGSLNFTRFYNSLNSDSLSSLGYGWSHTYNYYVLNRQDTAWDIHYPDGHIATFIPMNNLGQSFPIFSGTTDSLQKNINNDSYTLFTKEKLQYHFDAEGKLDSTLDLDSNITKLNYTGDKLNSIVAPGGRTLVITYSGNEIASVKDPLNRICNYSYDANGNLITVKGANNGTASFTYDGGHRMLTAVNPLGNIIVDNTYDGSGKVVSQKDAYNEITSIAYNFPNAGDATVTNPDNSLMVAHHDNYFRKTNIKDELGFTKTFAYDTNSNETGFTNENNQNEARLFDNEGNQLTDTLPGSKIAHITYNSFNSPVLITDAKGNQKRFYYNSINNDLDSIRYPDNSLQVFYYNNEGQVIQSVDGNGNSTTYTYSTAGDLLSIKTIAGVKQFAYDAAGRKISSTDEKGHTTTYNYDNNDNIIKITDPLGRTIENTYDANNQLLSVKDKKGFITTYAYDKKGRKISSTNPKGGVTTYTYDVRDNLISVTDPDNKVVSYTYDAKGRKTSATNALGTTQYQYDGVGNLIKIIDPTSKTSEYTYTATNKKLSQEDGLGNTAKYSYDLNDNLTSVTDALNRVTSYGYDGMNRIVSVEDAASKTTLVTYDKNGNKKTVVDPNGHTRTYTYDAVNRLINYKDAVGNNYTYSYDSAGNNITLTKPTGTIGKVFDAANRVTTVNNSTGNNYHFTYDDDDNVISMSNNVGTSNMVYDNLNQLIQYQDPYNKTVSFTYDAAGKKTSVIYPGSKTVTYSYDNANNLKSVTDWLSHTFIYTYDAAGRITQLLYPNATSCDYGFDNAGRLISKVNSLSNNTIISSGTFSLDAIGNRIAEKRIGQVPSALSPLSRKYSYANDDRMLSDSIWNFVNDNSGNRTSETNSVKSASYTFSVDNLLNSWTDSLGNNSTYSYDPLGHRISKVVGASTDKYVLDISSGLSQILQITDAGGVLKSNYVYGLGLLESIDATNNPLYYHFDAQHNTTALTNQSGVIKDTYTYDPFGTILNHVGTTVQPFAFLGEYGVEQESSTLYYARARYYDAANGRFLSKDSYPFDLNNPQTIDRYVYGLNNPLINYDPSGQFSWTSAISAGLQLVEGFGDLAQATLSIISPTNLGIVTIPSAVLSAGSSFNDATKDFNAYYKNLVNAFNSNDNWVTTDNSSGLLDFIYDDPIVSKVNDVNNIIQAFGSIKDYAAIPTDILVGAKNDNKILDLNAFWEGLKSATSLGNSIGQTNEGYRLSIGLLHHLGLALDLPKDLNSLNNNSFYPKSKNATSCGGN